MVIIEFISHLKKCIYYVKKIYFHKKPKEIYDLKGSSIGRQATEKERELGYFKDLDLLDKQRVFQIGKTNSSELLKQLILDVKFLESNQIMDYSFLIGVIKIDEKNQEEENKLFIQHLENKRKFHLMKNEEGNEIYYFGIIDYLTRWSLLKMAAQQYKSLSHDVTQLSTVSPEAYAKRFIHFIENFIQ